MPKHWFIISAFFALALILGLAYSFLWSPDRQPASPTAVSTANPQDVPIHTESLFPPWLTGLPGADTQPGLNPVDPAIPPRLAEALSGARTHKRNGNWTAALEAYRQIVSDGEAPAECLLELAQVELAKGETQAANDTTRQLLALNPDTIIQTRARFLLTNIAIEQQQWDQALELDAASAPDGLTDLFILKRAEAALGKGHQELAKSELNRPEMRQSTNRVILARAGDLAKHLGDMGLAADLYARAGTYPTWSVERSRLLKEACVAFSKADQKDQGHKDQAIQQCRTFIEDYNWTADAEEVLTELERLGGGTPYHRGLVAIGHHGYAAAKVDLKRAAAGGQHKEAASRLIQQLDELVDWSNTQDEGSIEAYGEFLQRFPKGTYAAEARFQQGLIHYQDNRTQEALDTWNSAATVAQGDELARLHFWASKALADLGHEAESRERLQTAAQTPGVGYYALRARDLLAGIASTPGSWPSVSESVEPDLDAEQDEAKQWLAEWCDSEKGVDEATDNRVRRGLGLLALGYTSEATAEFNALIDECQDGYVLYRLAQLLSQHELWNSASRAACSLVSLSPNKSVAEAPIAIRRLAYPNAYADLVNAQAGQHGLDPLLLLAMIHQESGYDPFARSMAQARGLTQVVPATGNEIASVLGYVSFAENDLHRPVVSIEFGAWFLANQLATFGGDPFLGLAACNAGGAPVSRWTVDDPDLFVERIDYPETRSYIQRLYLHHAIYRGLVSSHP